MKKTKPEVSMTEVVVEPSEKTYYAFNLKPHNLFEFETITVRDGKIVDTVTDEPTYLFIAMDRLRRAIHKMFYSSSRVKND